MALNRDPYLGESLDGYFTRQFNLMKRPERPWTIRVDAGYRFIPWYETKDSTS